MLVSDRPDEAASHRAAQDRHGKADRRPISSWFLNARDWMRDATIRAEAWAQAFGIGPFKRVPDADYDLRFGQVLARLRRFEEAGEALQRSFELRPSRAAYVELLKLRGAKSTFPLVDARSETGSADIIYFEVDDILAWGRDARTLSGIQRVAVSVIQQALARLSQNPGGYAFVCGSAGRAGFWQAHPEDLQHLVDAFVGDAVPQNRLVEIIDRIERRAVLVRLTAGQCYFVLGAFWAFHRDPTRYIRLKAAGIVVGVYIYDLLPLSHPEYFRQDLVNEFTLAVGDGFALFDFVVTISKFTAQEVRRFQHEHDLRRVRVEAVPLAHPLPKAAAYGTAPWRGVIAPLQGRSFVLFVSTIDPRKNHAYLVDIWERFLKAGLDPPDLVFVGRRDPHWAGLLDRLEAMNYFGGRVHVIENVSDVQLETLYAHCLFTTYPSFVEGWGLPVGESLAHGRPCVASNTSSIPEVAGDLADYVDPRDPDSGAEIFRRMIFDAGYRARREKAVREQFVARTWHQVADDLLGAIATLRREKAETWRVPLLLEGELFVPGGLHPDYPVPANYLAQPLRLIMAADWYWSDAAGICAWMQGDEGSLRFRTELAPGTELVVYLLLIGASWTGHQVVDIAIGGCELSPAEPEEIEADHRRLCQATGLVGAEGSVDVLLRATGTPAPPAARMREHRVGLISLGYARAADMARRTAILGAMSQ